MKKIVTLVAFFACVAFVGLQSCSDDDSAPSDVLVTSHRANGTFYKLNTKTGEKTEIFTATIGGSTLTEVRAFVYHPKEKLFYASANSYVDFGDGERRGFLYSMNPKTKEATIINNNDGNGGDYAVWDAIVNWAVADDDSLIAVGDFNADASDGIVKFGTDGGRSNWTIPVDFCCGLGLLYDKKTEVMLVGSSENSSDGEVIIETINSDGEITETSIITTLTDFPDDLSASWLNLKSMAEAKNGTVYGILHDYDSGKSYFVKIDIAGEEVTYISTLGLDWDNQYNVLAFIPGNFAK